MVCVAREETVNKEGQKYEIKSLKELMTKDRYKQKHKKIQQYVNGVHTK